jgi:ADP-heptose:LPS heptosyltransferase
VKEQRLKNALKKFELAVRRGFIASLQFRSRFRKPLQRPSLPLQLSADPTILFLRQDRLGDAIISTPVFIELHKRYPNAHFIVLLGDNNKGIADLLPIPCEVVLYRKKPFSDIAMLRKLRKRRIDVLIDLMDNPSTTSSILTSAISAQYSVGIQKENASSYNITVPLIDRAKFHIARRIAELLRPFGIDPDSIGLRAHLKNNFAEKISDRLGLVISAGVPDKQLPPETSAAIASEALLDSGIKEVMLFYHPKDRSLAEFIQRKASDQRVKLAPLTNTFTEYAALLQTCEYVITPDTSAVHLCSAYEIPVVVLTNPYSPLLHYWTPIGVPYEMIAQDLRTVSSATVIAHLKTLMQKVKPKVLEAVAAV